MKICAACGRDIGGYYQCQQCYDTVPAVDLRTLDSEQELLIAVYRELRELRKEMGAAS